MVGNGEARKVPFYDCLIVDCFGTHYLQQNRLCKIFAYLRYRRMYEKFKN